MKKGIIALLVVILIAICIGLFIGLYSCEKNNDNPIGTTVPDGAVTDVPDVTTTSDKPVTEAPVTTTSDKPVTEAPVTTITDKPVTEAPVTTTSDKPVTDAAPATTTTKKAVTEAPTTTAVKTVTYTVDLVTNTDKEYEQTIVKKGQKVALPQNLSKYGYKFKGWYDNKACTGTPVANEYKPTKNVTLYAGFEKVVYLYLYYGTLTDNYRLEYAPGTTVSVADFPKIEAETIDGYSCPFLKWVYEFNGADVPSRITLNSHVYIKAVYDESVIPPKAYITANEDGSYTTTGNVAYVIYEKESCEGVYSADLEFSKGSSGSANLAIRMILSGNNYAYEDAGTSYLSLGIVPKTGAVQLGSVTNGKFAHFYTQLGLTSLPKSWQDKFNSANGTISVNLTVVSYADGYSFYIDGDLVGSYTDVAKFEPYDACGFGVRCSTKGTIYKNFTYKPLVNVSFNTNGGTETASIKWGMGRISLPTPTKDGFVFAGWYYDEGLSNAVDANSFKTSGDITLYAKWDKTVKTVKFVTNGGNALDDISFADSVTLPAPTRQNYIFDGWYYDSAFANAVDVDNLVCEGTTVTIYAKWRFPNTTVTANGDGSYTTTAGKLVAIQGSAPTEGSYVIEMTASFTKGTNAGVGIAFRFSGISGDNPWQNAGDMYIMAQVNPKNGSLQIAKSTTFAHLLGTNAVGTNAKTLASMPKNWQDKYNGVEAGGTISAKLKVIDKGDSFEFYIDDEFAYSYTFTDAEKTTYNGREYGVRIGTAFVPCTYSLTCSAYLGEG